MPMLRSRHTTISRTTTLWAAIAWAALTSAAQADQAVLHMQIGDPARSGNEVPLVLDGITDTQTGKLITPPEMARRLSDTGLLFVGETHTSQGFHDVQLRVITELHRAGREVLIGLEMFPYTEQAALTGWNDGLYTEAGFVQLADWYKHWGYRWEYYRDIFLYAQKHGLRMFAVNSPREVVTAVRKKGYANLTEEEAAHIPHEIVPVTDDQRRMYNAFFEADDTLHRALDKDALEGMYRAQTTWDATMGWNALQALKDNGGKEAIMVVLIGSGHVTFGLGAERQVAPWYDGKISSIIPIPVVDEDGLPIETVRASYANFIWGLPEETEPLYPSLGISMMGPIGKEPTKLIQISDDSVGQRAGLLVGDILLTFDGQPVESSVQMRKLVSGYRWGDEADMQIRREGKTLTLRIPFRRAAK